MAGCLKVSQECKHGYAEGIARRLGQRVWGPPATTPRRLFGLEHWHVIEQTPWLNWLLLTKRPEHIERFCLWAARGDWPDNVWLGTSIGLQQHAAPRLDALLAHPAVVRFVSCEPLLGPLALGPWLPRLQWVICGGESGPHARPMWSQWARSLREQCQAAGGRLLDGRTWDELPPEGPLPHMPEALPTLLGEARQGGHQ